jgi:hypothetical protein
MDPFFQNEIPSVEFYINWDFKLACIRRLALGVTKSKLLWCREQETSDQLGGYIV